MVFFYFWLRIPSLSYAGSSFVNIAPVADVLHNRLDDDLLVIQFEDDADIAFADTIDITDGTVHLFVVNIELHAVYLLFDEASHQIINRLFGDDVGVFREKFGCFLQVGDGEFFGHVRYRG